MASTSAPTSNFQSIFDSALSDYSRQTGISLATHPFVQELQDCHSADDLLSVLQGRTKQFQTYRDGNRELINYLKPIVHVLHTFSGFLAEATALAPVQPTKAIIVGIDVLLAAVTGVSSSYDAMVDLFECVGGFIDRLRIYTEIPFSAPMSNIVIKVMVEVLSILSLATKQVKEGRLKKFAKKLLRESEVEDVLRRLDRLTLEEARMAGTETLQVVHDLVVNMKLVMDDGKASMEGIQQTLVTLQETANELNKMKRDQLQEKLRSWLSPPDPSENHNTARDVHYGETAAWFTGGRTFKEWQETGSLLWVHGKPGSGKSIFCSTIIQEVKAKCDRGLALMGYYYFDSNHIAKQSIRGVLASLLSQLSAKSDPCYSILSGLYSKNNAGSQQPSNDALTECLKKILRLPQQPTKYIILDALDECPNTSGFPTAREEVLDLVEDLVGLSLPDLRICVTSRPEIDIQNAFEPLTSLRMSLHDESGQRQDILDYIQGTVHSDRKMRRWRSEDKQLVIDILSSRAEGMFRWVYCQLETLRRCFPGAIQRTLDELPETLDETYERTLLRIEKEKREFAHRLFQCLIAAVRPLHVDELAAILAIRFDSGQFPQYHMDWRSEDSREAMLSACSSLIAVVNVDGSPVVQFSHFSVKEFLTSNRLAESGENLSRFHVLLKSAHMILAQASLCILLSLGHDVDKKRIEQIPFTRYAAQHWIDHSRFEDVSSKIQDAMEHLFNPAEPSFATWIWIFDIDFPFRDHMLETHPPRPEAPPLYYATLCGFQGLVEHLIASHPGGVNVTGGYHGSPLNAALAKGNVEIATLLLHCGANVYTGDLLGNTALHQAAEVGRHEVVELLLGHGATVDIWNRENETPLHVASREGAVDIVRTLLQHGAGIDTRTKAGCTPCFLASRYGHLPVVQLLIHSGAVIDSPNNNGWAPLLAASRYGRLEVLRFLIQSGAAVNSAEDNGWSPLKAASRYGHLEVVRLLIQSGAAVDSQNKEGSTPLLSASRYGHLEIVLLLIQSGAAVHSPNNDGRTSLLAASRYGHLEVVRLLIQNGAPVDFPDNNGCVPLRAASRNGNLEIVRFLIQSGATQAPDNDLCTPLSVASQYGHLETVRFLIQNGAAIDFPDNNGWTPLKAASRYGHLEIVRLLIQSGAAVDSPNKEDRTPLMSASRYGHLKTVRFLIQSGAAIDFPDNYGWTPLKVASRYGHLEVVRLLIQSGAAVDYPDKEGWTPLMSASRYGHLEVVRFIIQSGAAVDFSDSEGWTPLKAASRYGHLEVVLLLIHSGAVVHSPNINGWTSLFVASLHGHQEVVRLLIQNSAPVDSPDEEGWTPLKLASQNGHLETVRLLIQSGAAVSSSDNGGWFSLSSASIGGHLDIVQELLDHNADVNSQDSELWTPLHFASVHGHLSIVKLLIQYGAEINRQNKDQETPLDLASDNGHHEVAKFLAEQIRTLDLWHGSDIGDTKSLSMQSNLVQPSLGCDEDPSVLEGWERTPLCAALDEGDLDCVQSLLDCGADPSERDGFHQTPLHITSITGRYDIAEVLIHHGANVNLRDRAGRSPLNNASRNGHLDIALLLVTHGADVNAKQQGLWTPLHLASNNSHLKIIRLLLDQHASVEARNEDGRTACQLALRNGDLEVVELFSEYGMGGE